MQYHLRGFVRTAYGRPESQIQRQGCQASVNHQPEGLAERRMPARACAQCEACKLAESRRNRTVVAFDCAVDLLNAGVSALHAAYLGEGRSVSSELRPQRFEDLTLLRLQDALCAI